MGRSRHPAQIVEEIPRSDVACLFSKAPAMQATPPLNKNQIDPKPDSFSCRGGPCLRFPICWLADPYRLNGAVETGIPSRSCRSQSGGRTRPHLSPSSCVVGVSCWRLSCLLACLLARHLSSAPEKSEAWWPAWLVFLDLPWLGHASRGPPSIVVRRAASCPSRAGCSNTLQASS